MVTALLSLPNIYLFNSDIEIEINIVEVNEIEETNTETNDLDAIFFQGLYDLNNELNSFDFSSNNHVLSYLRDLRITDDPLSITPPPPKIC